MPARLGVNVDHVATLRQSRRTAYPDPVAAAVLAELPSVGKAIAAAEKALGADGRVLVRFSGTENKVRVLVEGPDAKRIRAHADAIAEELKKALG